MTELIAAIPWFVCLLVFAGMFALCWRLVSALDMALERQQGAAPPAHAPIALNTPVPAKPALPAEVAKTSAPFDGWPAWFQAALHEIGFHETGNNGGLDRYIALAHCGANGDPWCAIFANAMLEQSGVAGTRSASSQSFRSHPGFVQLQGPAPGAIAVYWRGTPDSGLGHVGFYRGEDAARVWTLGGNENDMVQIEALPKQSASFGLIGYWWPKSVPLPKEGSVAMAAGSPASIQAPPADLPGVAANAPAAPNGKQTGIVATMFGGEQSAYGGPINDSGLGIALPFRFEGARPKVRVTNTRNSLSADCDIVDVGPWNTNDPYWQHGARPQAETGTDMRGRHTNKAGIDLTFAAAKALQIDGKGLVDWEFISEPLPPTKIT